MAVSKRLRYEILRRDNHACRYCGAKAPDVALVVDHVTPVALGGSDTPSNLVAACAACNGGKAASNPDAEIVAGVSDDALRWATAVKKAADLQRAEVNAACDYAEQFLAAWATHWTAEAQGSPSGMRLPGGWEQSVTRFRDLGLEIEHVQNAVLQAMAVDHIPERNLFKYFCGICWNLYRQRQEMARDIYEADGS